MSNVSTFVEQSLILKQEVLLATVLVYACSNDGQKILCRVLIDPGSQSSFVTRAFVQRLRLKPSLLKSGININGIGGVKRIPTATNFLRTFYSELIGKKRTN